MSSNVSFGGCGSVCAHAAIKSFLPPFYPSRDKFTRPSSRLFFFRVKGRQRERTAWVRGYLEDFDHMLDMVGRGLQSFNHTL